MGRPKGSKNKKTDLEKKADDMFNTFQENPDLAKFVRFMEIKGQVFGFKVGFVFGGLFVLLVLGLLKLIF